MKYAFKKKHYLILVSLTDFLGAIIFFFLKFPRRRAVQDPKKILVVRLDHIGDYVATTPLFAALKEKYPGSRITLLAAPEIEGLARADHNIDDFLPFSASWMGRNKDRKFSLCSWLETIKQLRRRRFDLGFDPRGDFPSIVMMFLGAVGYRCGYGITGGAFLLHSCYEYPWKSQAYKRYCKLADPAAVICPKVYLDLPESAEQLDNENRTHLVLHPFAGTPAKQWPEHKVREFIGLLEKEGITVTIIGTLTDKGDFPGCRDMRGKLDILQTARLIKTAGLFAGMDSGPANIALALGVPSLVICSGTNMPELWLVPGECRELLYHDTDCKPCSQRVCPKKRQECMEEISAAAALSKIKVLLQKSKKAKR